MGQNMIFKVQDSRRNLMRSRSKNRNRIICMRVIAEQIMIIPYNKAAAVLRGSRIRTRVVFGKYGRAKRGKRML